MKDDAEFKYETSVPTECGEQRLLFRDFGPRPVVDGFNDGDISSDGGAVLLGQTDRNRGHLRGYIPLHGSSESTQPFSISSRRSLYEERYRPVRLASWPIQIDAIPEPGATAIVVGLPAGGSMVYRRAFSGRGRSLSRFSGIGVGSDPMMPFFFCEPEFPRKSHPKSTTPSLRTTLG